MPDDHSEVVPLLPIPNRTVKRFSADDSAGSRVKVGHCQAINLEKPSRKTGFFFEDFQCCLLSLLPGSLGNRRRALINVRFAATSVRMLARFIQIAIACSVAVMFLLALWLPGLLVLATAFGVVLFYCAWLAMQFRLMVAVNANEDADAGHSFALLARSWWLEVVVSIQAFAWWQPFRSKANPDQVPPCAEEGAGQRGIVLVHGFACNRGIWMPWFEKLRKRRIPYIAVNLEPVLGSIDDYSPLLDKAVSAMFSATGSPPLLVGHSMGGLAARAWLRRMQDSTRVHQFVTIGTPHHGTLLGHFGPRMSALVNGNQMRFGSPWLTELARSESLRCCKMFTCFYSNCDNIVMPTGSATLNGADNRLISGVPHLAMVADESIIEQTLAML